MRPVRRVEVSLDGLYIAANPAFRILQLSIPRCDATAQEGEVERKGWSMRTVALPGVDRRVPVCVCGIITLCVGVQRMTLSLRGILCGGSASADPLDGTCPGDGFETTPLDSTQRRWLEVYSYWRFFALPLNEFNASQPSG
jgi:hypothetical protein